MKPNRLLSIFTVLVLCIATQAQRPISQIARHEKQASVPEKIEVSTLLAQAGSDSRRPFSLMPSSSAANISNSAIKLTPMAAGPSLTVLGGGTLGRLTKWTGFTSSNSFIGDSTIFEDKFGKVGIGTDTPTSKLTVAGTIESTSGGVKFPDGSVQTTAGVAANDVVRSLNGLKGDVTLAGGANITITPTGNTLTIAATGAEEPGRMPYQETKVFSFTGLCALGTCDTEFSAVPAGKRLVIKNISAVFRLSPNVYIEDMSFGHGSSSNLQVFVPTTLQGKTGGASPVDHYMANQSVLAFAGVGNTPTVHVQTSDIPGSFVQAITLTGYYVDVP